MVAIAIVPTLHEAKAKVCVSTVSSDNNDINNADTTCNHHPKSIDDDHSTIKDKTPFLLAIPFP